MCPHFCTIMLMSFATIVEWALVLNYAVLCKMIVHSLFNLLVGSHVHRHAVFCVSKYCFSGLVFLVSLLAYHLHWDFTFTSSLVIRYFSSNCGCYGFTNIKHSKYCFPIDSLQLLQYIWLNWVGSLYILCATEYSWIGASNSWTLHT